MFIYFLLQFAILYLAPPSGQIRYINRNIHTQIHIQTTNTEIHIFNNNEKIDFSLIHLQEKQ